MEGVFDSQLPNGMYQIVVNDKELEVHPDQVPDHSRIGLQLMHTAGDGLHQLGGTDDYVTDSRVQQSTAVSEQFGATFQPAPRREACHFTMYRVLLLEESLEARHARGSSELLRAACSPPGARSPVYIEELRRPTP